MRGLRSIKRVAGCTGLLALALAACGNLDEEAAGSDWNTLTVTASAYTLAADETDDGPPGLAAWGDVLKPGMRAIAVSRDLIRMGLGYGAIVKIDGLAGTYTVLDKMNRRWKKKIDILMASKKRALAWGRQQVTIHWREAPQAGD